MSESLLPLEGVKVLDFSRLLPGPLCTLELANLGAEVIKIEDLHKPDNARFLPPLLKGLSTFYLAVNRNKKSLAWDFKDSKFHDVMHHLLDKTDILVEGFRPGTMEMLGLSWEHLKDKYPRLIYCSISGFGQTGPWRDKSGHDINYLALSGALLSPRQMGVKKEPMLPNFQIADVVGGAQSAVSSILAALLLKNRNDRGTFLDISIFDNIFTRNVYAFSQLKPGLTDVHNEPQPEMPNGGWPNYNLYQTSDGQWMALGALEKKFWERFCMALEKPQYIPLHSGSGLQEEQVINDLRKIFSRYTRAHWESLFSRVDCCLTPVLDLEDAIQSPHVNYRQLIQKMNPSTKGELKVLQNKSHFETPPSRAAPELGQHNAEILKELGLDL